MFPATHLSVIARIRSDDAQSRRVAFDDLARGYWQPSYRYLRWHWHLDPADAEDAVQSFFSAAFEKHYLDRFDPAKAKFRTFLRLCLDRFVQNLRKADTAAKRGGTVRALSLDFAGAERELAQFAGSSAAGDAERFFHDETVRALFGRAVDRIRRDFLSAGTPQVFDVFDRHDIRPTAATTYSTVAHELNLSTAQVTNYLHIARRAFREAALDALREISASEAEFELDARTLFGAEISK